ncbi:MAG: hypothetical protein RBR59_06765 [Sulfurimonadaceae bacterium]|jgi:hypothetical protein|nr:hypothetical protein [Sulfurimonadaceae bacterium]
MQYPDFFKTIEPIKVQDPLSQVLGAFEAGEYEFTYLDVVKSAGHSCPTVAGAYLVTQKALEILYPNQRAVRGDIKVEFSQNELEGVAGVIANVISQITGATKSNGFKGLQGKFARHSLMEFDVEQKASYRFSRNDTGASVLLEYDPSTVPPSPKMMPLMQNMPNLTPEEKKEFGMLWQERVKNIFLNKEQTLNVIEA